MTDQELRVLVRDAIATHLGRGTMPVESPFRGEGRITSWAGRDLLSYGQFGVPSGPEGTCIIEPSVMCNHCGYCKSYGH
jgi:hypothetical protein